MITEESISLEIDSPPNTTRKMVDKKEGESQLRLPSIIIQNLDDQSDYVKLKDIQLTGDQN